MTDHGDARPPVLYAIVCGAGPAADAGRLVAEAAARGWDVWVIMTPTVADYFVDPAALARVSGHPVRTGFRRTGAVGGLPRADAAVVAPATYNTINKWALGIADTFALSTLAELTGAVPILFEARPGMDDRSTSGRSGSPTRSP